LPNKDNQKTHRSSLVVGGGPFLLLFLLLPRWFIWINLVRKVRPWSINVVAIFWPAEACRLALPAANTRLFSQLSPCLSRACLGKMIVFWCVLKWLQKKGVSRTCAGASQPAGLGGLPQPPAPLRRSNKT
jgi:hypothetical protein